MSLRSGALFAGYGGLDLAVETVFGAKTAWVADVCGDSGRDRPHKSPHGAPCTILAHRFPGVPNLGDVTRIEWGSVEPVDILTGGSPCQDLSHAGKRAGMRTGTRSGLWASMCDAIETIRPRYVVWENVRGALSAEADSAVESCPLCVGDGRGVTLRALGRVLGDLAELGYDACWTGVRAADVGAPHGRFRVFVLAWDASRPAGLGGHAAPSVTADLGHEWPRTPRDGRTGPADRGREPVALLPTPAVNDMGASYDVLPTPTATDAHASGGYNPDWGHGTTLTDATVRRIEAFGQYAAAIARWETVLGRPAPAPTEPTGRGGAHRLSPRFVEWMMGLPDGWVTETETTRNEQLKALGNGVVPQQASAALRHLLALSRAVHDVGEAA